MKNISFLIAVVAVALLTGCFQRGIRGDGNIVSEKRTIGDFTRLEASGAYDIRWTNGPVALTLTTDTNLLAHIKTEVSGDTLKIYSDEPIAPSKDVKVVLSSSGLKDVSVAGAIHLVAGGISGPGLNLSAAGAVDIELGGNVTNLTANLAGASELEAGGLEASSVDIALVGASSGRVAVADRLKASIAGAGSLTYIGNPASVDKTVVGAGSVRREK